MVRIIEFFVGFLTGFFKMIIGSVIICSIIGFFFFPALYVLVPLCIILSFLEAIKEGKIRSGKFVYDKENIKQLRKNTYQLNRLKKLFKEDELYEFNNAWKQMNRH